jgi:hypothetical protein
MVCAGPTVRPFLILLVIRVTSNVLTSHVPKPMANVEVAKPVL